MGEVCSNGTRLLVHDDVRQEFVRRLCEKTARIRPGDPMDPSTVDDDLLSRWLLHCLREVFLLQPRPFSP